MLGPRAWMPVGSLAQVMYGLCIVRIPASLPWCGGVHLCLPQSFSSVPALAEAAQSFLCLARVCLSRIWAACLAQPCCWHFPCAGMAGMQWVSLAPLHPFQAKIWAGISLPREMSSLLRVSGRAFPTFKDHLSPPAPLPPAVSPLLLLALQLIREQSWGGSSGVGGLSSVIWGAWLCPPLRRSDIASGHLPLGTVSGAQGRRGEKHPSKGAAAL